jgi:hypothetical protein
MMFRGAKASAAGKPLMKFYINLQPKLKTIVYVGEVMAKNTNKSLNQLLNIPKWSQFIK